VHMYIGGNHSGFARSVLWRISREISQGDESPGKPRRLIILEFQGFWLAEFDRQHNDQEDGIKHRHSHS
jgi:hypothetical protein